MRANYKLKNKTRKIKLNKKHKKKNRNKILE